MFAFSCLIQKNKTKNYKNETKETLMFSLTRLLMSCCIFSAKFDAALVASPVSVLLIGMLFVFVFWCALSSFAALVNVHPNKAASS